MVRASQPGIRTFNLCLRSALLCSAVNSSHCSAVLLTAAITTAGKTSVLVQQRSVTSNACVSVSVCVSVRVCVSACV